jgi:death-on-curing protein
MISLKDVFIIHYEAIKRFGGSFGVRDQDVLESALSRPFQTFGGVDLYPTSIEKAAAIGESIIMNHPFVDGNKRTGYILMEIILRMNNLKINASDEELYLFIIDITTGKNRYDQIVLWLQNHTQPC